jgi:hypothetical protein
MQRALLLVLVAAAACTSASDIRPSSAPSGPPRVLVEAVERHQRELDEDIGARPAGTSREYGASTYVLAHLQAAGYLVLLDPVPVRNLVRSTNVIALTPSGDDPKAVVVAAYDTPEDEAGGGDAVGMLLELARALRAADTDHSVQFVALGAEHSDASGGNLGSRRLARELLDDEVEPVVVTILGARDGAFAAAGRAASDIAAAAGIDDPGDVDVFDPDVFGRAGFDHAWVSGGPSELGDALLQFLTSL